MKFRIVITILTIMITSAAFGLACGSASAPPVDLPAPITGRVDVSTPDVDGNVTITGTAGAVSGGAMVMAVNETVAGAQASGGMFVYKIPGGRGTRDPSIPLLGNSKAPLRAGEGRKYTNQHERDVFTGTINILSVLTPSAWAQAADFPSVCSETGHACATADAEGAFVIVLAASIGDSIAIGVIDPTTGEFTSELLRAEIEAPGSGEAVCSGVAGAVVDIALIPDNGTPIILKQGSETARNQIVIGISLPVTRELSEGCSAHSIAAFATSSNTAVIAVTSQDDKKLWTGTYNLSDQTFTGENVFTLEHEPMDIIFLNDSASAVVAIRDASSVFLQKLSLSDASAQSDPLYPLSGNVAVTGLTRSLRLDVTHMNTRDAGSEQHLALAVTDNGSGTGAYITLFDADRMAHLGSWPASTWSASGLSSIKDAAFWVQDLHVRIIAISGDSKGAVLSPMWAAAGIGPLSYEVETISDLTDLTFAEPALSVAAASFSFTPVDVAVSENVLISASVDRPTAIITSTVGEVYLLPLPDFASGLTTHAVLRTIQSGSAFSAIASDDDSRSIYVANETAGDALVVDGLAWSN